MPEKFYSLSQITEHLQKLLKKTYSNEYWIKAEIAKLNYYPKSGHCYPDLVEKNDEGIKAQIRGIIWNSTLLNIQSKFLEATGSELSDGMEILFKASLDYNPVHGLSLHISDIDANYSLGKMAAEKLKSIQRLKNEDFFFLNKALKFPMLPKRIAIISVETSKGFHDFKNIIDNNSRGYKFYYLLFPAILQGDVAVDSIIKQLARIEKVKDYFDIVAIIRGGGGDVGLSCYNDYNLAKAVSTFPLPIVSGIGHSTNETVVEMVSNLNTITPTDLAYLLQQKFDNIAVRLDEIGRKVVNNSAEYFAINNSFIKSLALRLKIQQKNFIDNNMLKLNNLKYDLSKYSRKFIPMKLEAIQDLIIIIETAHRRKISIEKDIIQRKERELIEDKSNFLIKEANKIRHLEKVIKILDPINILRKGFSISRINGKALKSSDKIEVGNILETELSEGKLESKIHKIK